MHPCDIIAIILGVVAIICLSIIKVSPDWPEWAENLVSILFGIGTVGAIIIPMF